MDATTINVITAIASAIAAFLALIVSVASVAISVAALKIQRRHNVLSVRPIPEITLADYENSLRVKVRNNGSGPIIISKLEVKNDQVVRSSVIEWMPNLPNGRAWTHFSHNLVNRSLSPGAEIILLELTISSSESQQTFAVSRDKCRRYLSELTITVHYTDIYGSNFEPYIRNLEWFGRHLWHSGILNKVK